MCLCNQKKSGNNAKTKKIENPVKTVNKKKINQVKSLLIKKKNNVAKNKNNNKK